MRLDDACSILGCDKRCTLEDAQKKYRRLALTHHPDRCPDDPGATAKFQTIGEAWSRFQRWKGDGFDDPHVDDGWADQDGDSCAEYVPGDPYRSCSGLCDVAWVTSWDPITGARNFVVRLGDSLAKTGIVVDDGGAIQSAPGGLFDAGYVVAAIDGQPFRPSMRDVGGPQTVTVRCENADVLASLAKVPAKRLRDKTLKMLQVQVSPDDKGFGIDLADFKK